MAILKFLIILSLNLCFVSEVLSWLPSHLPGWVPGCLVPLLHLAAAFCFWWGPGCRERPGHGAKLRASVSSCTHPSSIPSWRAHDMNQQIKTSPPVKTEQNKELFSFSLNKRLYIFILHWVGLASYAGGPGYIASHG